MDQQFLGVNQRLDKVEDSIHSLEETVKNNATEFRGYFRHIDNKLEHHDNVRDAFYGSVAA
jgi:hypothetical protein